MIVAIVVRYAAGDSSEIVIDDANQHSGVGQARHHTKGDPVRGSPRNHFTTMPERAGGTAAVVEDRPDPNKIDFCDTPCT